jgi:hypothetical protein
MVQLITSTNGWLASKPVADEERETVTEEEEPPFVKTATT